MTFSLSVSIKVLFQLLTIFNPLGVSHEANSIVILFVSFELIKLFKSIHLASIMVAKLRAEILFQYSVHKSKEKLSHLLSNSHILRCESFIKKLIISNEYGIFVMLLKYAVREKGSINSL